MPLQIPHPTTPLHLYRHLLRESTYLPALCRPWIASRIQQRFRDRRWTKPADAHVKEAHSSLRYMRSANSGHVKRLERLCFMATGRVGKRRRILATTQLSHRPPADTDGLEQSRIEAAMVRPEPPKSSGKTAISAIPASLKFDWLDNWSVDMLEALSRSQLSQQATDWPKAMRRALDTRKITEGKNCFGRPYSPRLKRNKFKKYYVSVLRQILPPLPQGEWDHLASLVQGDANVDELTIPCRRPVAQPVRKPRNGKAADHWDWSRHALTPARVIERPSNRQQKSLSGEEDHDPRGHGTPLGIRFISPRKLQRIYCRIWTMSPTMKQDPRSQKWSVTWGKDDRKISPASASDMMFFEGVTDQGKIIREGTSCQRGNEDSP
ncbi:hypothetical protein F4777DRAFT_589993 [Nemania sp. FL0916]|nr:hypothetical protein F4777DRAFT_589993 [Nemania sp. FL0916]